MLETIQDRPESTAQDSKELLLGQLPRSRRGWQPGSSHRHSLPPEEEAEGPLSFPAFPLPSFASLEQPGAVPTSAFHKQHLFVGCDVGDAF